MDAGDLIQRWVRPEVRALSAYRVADAGGLVKLDAMENPYTWPQSLREEWASLIRRTDVNRYPDPQARRLKQRLRQALGVPQGMELLLGNGSDEIIQMLVMALAGPGRTVLSVEPGFVMYRMIAAVCGADYRGVALRRDDFSLDLPALLQAMDESDPALVFLAWPNNPTGNLFAEEAVLQLIEAAPGVVVVDEAYAPFTDSSFLGRLGSHANLLVMRTLSKMGLAGLRLGLLAGPAAWIRELDKVRLPYNVNVLTQLSAEFALRHLDVFAAQTGNIRAERSRLLRALEAVSAVNAFPSEANFVLIRVPVGRAGELHQGLREQGVLVKNLHGAHPLVADCLRVTVGTPEENALFLEALRKLLQD